MKLLNTEVDFNFFNEDDMEKYDAAIELLLEKFSKLQATDDNVANHETMKSIRVATEECFDSLFGLEKRREILKDSKDIRDYFKVYKELVVARTNAINEEAELVQSLSKEIDAAKEQYSQREIKKV